MIKFHPAFDALTGHQPLRWQRRLFDAFAVGCVPKGCRLPTGLGKTSVIPIWVIALASQAAKGRVALPRRLVYVVNRRTVVDQATTIVEQIRNRLRDPDDPRWSKHEATLCELVQALKKLAATEESPLAVSTLRGELADNEEWKVDPARAAVIVGTVDMIGSKLLFSGYGDGRYARPHHAGLLGQDSLIVHDEAHLTPAFGRLLRDLVTAQQRGKDVRPIRVMELTATSRSGKQSSFALAPEDDIDQLVRRRLDARKKLVLHRIESEKSALVAKVTELGLAHAGGKAKVLIYVRSAETASEVAHGLSKTVGDNRVALLTGTIRGFERDRLVRENPVYGALLDSNERPSEAFYLVSTSAGEVGVDLDANHMICDAVPLDSLIQRLGRVNRRGDQEKTAQVDLVAQLGNHARQSTKIDEAIATTIRILERWAKGAALDVSPRNLGALLDALSPEERERAFSPEPSMVRLTEIFLDTWSLTTISELIPGTPEVASFLHGLEGEPPETFVAWRKEVSLLHQADISPAELTRWFQACRVLAHERLRDRSDRVRKALRSLLDAHRREANGREFPVVVLNERGQASWKSLSELTSDSATIEYRMLILPVEAGGLGDRGILDPKEISQVRDVCEESCAQGSARSRWLAKDSFEEPQYEQLLTGKGLDCLQVGLKEYSRVTLQEASEETGEGGTDLLLLLDPHQSAIERPEAAKMRQRLDLHLDLARKRVERIANALGIEDRIREALALAAARHDSGKARPIWQAYARNADGDPLLAKSERYLHWRVLAGYRHEFGSLLDVAADTALAGHPETDLILHLIAAHHGWARPHFRDVAWDSSRTTDENETCAVEAIRRFERLQRRFGRWGLAWLESLVRCADIAASTPGGGL